MSDYLIINSESLEVEKKFDKCVVEGFGNTTEDISSIIVPVEGSGPSITVIPLSVTENGTYQESGKAYSPVTVNVPAQEPNPSKIWRGSVSQYDALSEIEDDRLYIIDNTSNVPYIKFGTVPVVPPNENGYEAAIYDYTAPANRSYGNYMIPIVQINKYPSKGWQLEFNFQPDPNMSVDNIICGIGSGNDGLRELYLNTSGVLLLYDPVFGDHSIYNDGIVNKDVILRKAVGTGAFELFVDGVSVYTGTMSNYSNSETLSIGKYSSNYSFAGTLHYLKFKWLE